MLVTLLGALTLWACGATIAWWKERNESRDWKAVATTLGDEYDKLAEEAYRVGEKPNGTWQRQKPMGGAWRLN